MKELIAKKMTQANTFKLFEQLVDGMAYINEQSIHSYNIEIFHRDLKPDNLLITANDQLMIADFGIAK